MMGGKFWVISDLGQGSTFHFTCRLGKEHTRAGTGGEHKVKKLPNISNTRDVRTLTVLIVEDNQSNQWVFQELLKKQGYIVVSVADGVTALREIENRFFDLILLDLQLPEMNGYEVVYQIREHENKSGVGEGQHLPIIAMTGSAGEDEMQKCLDAGMNDFIAKPFTAGHLFSKIWKHIRYRSNSYLENPKPRAREAANTSIFHREIFNENDALKKASGKRELMIERIKSFLHKTPRTIEMLRKNIVSDDRNHLEQEVHRLKELAMEIGATSLADELFGLVMNLRKNQALNEREMDILAAEFEDFRNEQKIQTLSGE
jgi:CheY-like chemotaxis protein